MTTTDWQPGALVEGVRAEFDPDGSLHDDGSVEVKINFAEEAEIIFNPDDPDLGEAEVEELAEKYEAGELIDLDYQNGAYARLRYDVHDGVAVLSEFKDASPSSGNWISVKFLRTVMAAQRVVENVPGVERVEDAPETLGRCLMEGEEAVIERG